ncbi:class I SAM-dependent DNA methyltransferase [Brevundimonas sp. BT-123]|uniref:class I SAM-dependent DNA methyltransferase n=1 Tax=Brevundimonas sp. BT-123 TaxID=2986928 RepID=UPI00223644E3|nr:DNA methyltransferase [Brevundimonas sp. BT-123]MCW0045749.1 class I SAM-dependent DNA methyltransferase [Brevundimonas sp. BT-123]
MDVDTFIERWSQARGGAERANYQMFLTELCEALGLPRPDPASDDTRTNDYVFERGVKRRESEGLASTLRIDLYKRGCFILEAKQSRAAHRDDGQGTLFKADETASTAASQGKWDVLMRNARRQAEDYVFRLPADHAAPPFIIVCDVGYVFEVYADFSGSGRAYSHFPDRKGFRVRLEDLRDEKIVKRLKAIWTEPLSLDPTRESARVTRQIAERLAEVSKRLEKKHPAEEVAHFLMRCIFTMFAEDVDLLPRGRFTALLKDQLDHPESFAPMLQALWKSMDAPEYENRFYAGFGLHLRHFNGSLFKNAKAFPLGREEIGELLAASSHDWRYVEPAIFGTLVEQALEPGERRKLGAHYTPRSYVERLVEVTVMEPLRADWNVALIKAGDARERGDAAHSSSAERDSAKREAVAAIRAFHHQLCTTRVLDPACGTGNFLYVSLELMKRLEGEVLEALAELGETEGIGFETVDPHQFLGIELNVRAAAIAELVLWIGYLQQHYRNSVEHPAEPILKAFGNIQQKDAVLTWDGYPEIQFEMRDGVAVQVYPNARRPDWPEAEFIVGNPPFIGKGAIMRAALGDAYLKALKNANSTVAGSADFVMQWWDRAADLLTRRKSPLRRFGFVTTNSITQSFSRRVIEKHLGGKRPLAIIYAIPDHPWTKASRDAAAVRIAMTVVQAGMALGRLLISVSETDIDTDSPQLELSEVRGAIHADLSVGADATSARPMTANEGLSCNGVMLAGEGFVVSRALALHIQADEATRGSGSALYSHVGGSELTQYRRGELVIDFYGLSESEARQRFPAAFQHVLEAVKPEREKNSDRGFREKWWLFGRTRPEIRRANEHIPRYIATTRTSKHRIFQFLNSTDVANHEIVVISVADADLLAVLSSLSHKVWAFRAGGTLEDRPRYNKGATFDAFPFPDPSDALRTTLRHLGEELDATRKTVQAEHPDLTLTGLYNVLEKIRAGTPLDAKDQDVKERGRVLILKDLHDQIDRATADAYGWPHDLSDEQILERLVALNAERAAEEAAGHVRWLRPDYQIPRFAKGAAAKSGRLDLGETVVAIDKSLPVFPKDKGEQAMAIHAVLEAAHRPMDAAAVSRAFKGGGKRIEQRVVQALSTLVRYGWITALPGGTYAARRAA